MTHVTSHKRAVDYRDRLGMSSRLHTADLGIDAPSHDQLRKGETSTSQTRSDSPALSLPAVPTASKRSPDAFDTPWTLVEPWRHSQRDPMSVSSAEDGLGCLGVETARPCALRWKNYHLRSYDERHGLQSPREAGRRALGKARIGVGRSGAPGSHR